MVKLSDKLLEVCNKPAEPSKNYSMDKICRGLIRLTNNQYVNASNPLHENIYTCTHV